MKRTLLIVAISLLGCRGVPSGPELTGSGGSTGGSAGSSSGGTAGGGSGGATGEGTGGAMGSGGSSASGTGGHIGTGGATGSGGGTGGATGTGGNTGNGTGGSKGAGGSTGAGGTTGGGTGGSPSDAGRDSGGGDSRATGADTGPAGDATAQVSYATQIAPLLAANCTSCHGGSGPSAGISLNSYTNVKATANAANSAIQSGIMPSSGALSAANKLLFQTWVNQGMQNN